MPDNIGFFLTPPLEEGETPRATGSFGYAWHIASNSDNVPAGAAFIDFTTNEDAAREFFATGDIAPLPVEDPELKEGDLYTEIFDAWTTVLDNDTLLPYLEFATPTSRRGQLPGAAADPRRPAVRRRRARRDRGQPTEVPGGERELTLHGRHVDGCPGPTVPPPGSATHAAGRRVPASSTSAQPHGVPLRRPGDAGVRRVRAGPVPARRVAVVLQVGRHHHRHVVRLRQLPRHLHRPADPGVVRARVRARRLLLDDPGRHRAGHRRDHDHGQGPRVDRVPGRDLPPQGRRVRRGRRDLELDLRHRRPVQPGPARGRTRRPRPTLARRLHLGPARDRVHRRLDADGHVHGALRRRHPADPQLAVRRRAASTAGAASASCSPSPSRGCATSSASC